MKRVFIFVLFGMLVSASCFAQSANDAQRFIVGTWKSNHQTSPEIYIFNSNGTYTYGSDTTGKYFFSNQKLILSEGVENATLRDYYFSSDGRTLVLFWGGKSVWLIKQ